MNKNLDIKYWSDDEELQLIDEINKLTDIKEILQNHDRKITGILVRIEKILNDPVKLVKIFNKNEIVEKYLTNTKNKYFISYDELYSNILKFNSLEEISNNYNKLPLTKIKSILNNFLKKNDIDLAKKLRINCLLKTKDNLDLAKKTFVNSNINNNKNKNNNNNINNVNKVNKNNIKTHQNDINYINDDINNDINNTDNNINSVIILLLDEIKMMRTDIFDIKNRVKVIMDKVSVLEKKTNNTSNLKNCVYTKNLDLELVDDDNYDNQQNFNETIKTTKEKKSKDKKIKIIMDNNLNNKKNNNLSDIDNDELDKEFEKMLV